MFCHKCIPNFANPDDQDLDNKVLDQIIKFNSSTLNLNIDNKLSGNVITVEEPDQLGFARHYPHTNNLFTKQSVSKITALFIISDRDYIQGGELEFENWDEPIRTDNFGQVIGNEENNYPHDLNEKGSLIIFPSIEKVWSRRVVSGKLQVKLYTVMGDNYK